MNVLKVKPPMLSGASLYYSFKEVHNKRYKIQAARDQHKISGCFHLCLKVKKIKDFPGSHFVFVSVACKRKGRGP